MAREFKLPDLGEGIHEAEVQEVLVSEGDAVQEDDNILVVETDKAAVDISSPYTGTVEAVNVAPGDRVNVGDVMLVFGGEGDAEAAEAEPEAEDAEPEAKAEQQEPAEEAEPERAPDRAPGRPVPAAPSTRRLARELGVDLRDVPGSGPGGRVLASDVRAYAEEGPPEEPEAQAEEAEAETTAPAEARPLEIEAPPLPDFGQWGEIERVPVRSVRREIAKQMALSWSQIPHVTHRDEVDITALERLRQRHKARIKEEGGSLTLTVFVMKALVAALKEYPRFNASFDANAGEIVLKRYYHIGVAVDTERGLIVPVIRDVDRKSLTELAVELRDLVQRTREGKVKLDELQGGTMTITNIGPLGGTSFSPIINYPEVAILGMAQARWKPVVQVAEPEEDGGEPEMRVEPRFMLPLILTFDHRALDGADAGRFTRTLAELLDDPEALLLGM